MWETTQERREKQLMNKQGGRGYPSIDKPWLKYYTKEQIDTEIPDVSAYDYLKSCNIGNMQNPAILFKGQSFTYGWLLSQIDLAAAALISIGVRRGDKVVVVFPVAPEEIILFYAVDKIGACASYLMLGTPPEAVCESVDELKAERLFICGELFAPELRRMLYQNNTIQEIIYIGEIIEPAIESRPCACQVESWVEFLAKGENIPCAGIEINDGREEIPVFIAKTGGTTGKPKNVMLSDRGLNGVVHQYLHSPMDLGRGDRWLRLWPIFSATAAVSSNHLPLCAGMELLLRSEDWLGRVDEILLCDRPNHIPLTPAILDVMMDSPILEKADLSFLKTLGCGGMRMTLEFEQKAKTFFEAHHIHAFLGCGYGMTENSSTATARMNQDTTKIGDVGIPLPKTIVSVFSPYSDMEKTYNEVGELCIQSPNFMLGYYQNKELTDSILRMHADGAVWLHSRDLGYIDEDGHVFVCNRMVRVIPIFPSYKVYPSEVEDLIDMVSGVKESSVVACKDEEHPDCYFPICYAVLENAVDETIVRGDIAAVCSRNLPSYAVPRDICFLQEFPLTPMGKIDYQALEKRGIS